MKTRLNDAYLQIVFLSVSVMTKLSHIESSVVNVWLCVSSHVLYHVAFLCVASWAIWACVGSDAFMHAHMVKNAPCPCELFVAPIILACVHCCDASSAVLPLFNSALIVPQNLHVLPTLLDVRLLGYIVPSLKAIEVRRWVMEAINIVACYTRHARTVGSDISQTIFIFQTSQSIRWVIFRIRLSRLIEHFV